MLTNLIIWGTVLFFILIVFYAAAIITYAKKHKVDIAAAVEQAAVQMPLLTQIINLLEAMLPAPNKTLATSLGDMITKGIAFAEQLMDAGMLTADQRKTTAMNMITAALKAEGITPNDKTTAAISVAVDIAARVLLPHKSTPDASVDGTAPASAAQVPAAAAGAVQ